MDRTHGLFFNMPDPRTGAALKVCPFDSSPVLPSLSAVDNAWLADDAMQHAFSDGQVEQIGWAQLLLNSPRLFRWLVNRSSAVLRPRIRMRP